MFAFVLSLIGFKNFIKSDPPVPLPPAFSCNFCFFFGDNDDLLSSLRTFDA